MTNERRFYRVEKEARKEKDRQLKWKKDPNESGLIDPRGKLEEVDVLDHDVKLSKGENFINAF